MKGRIMPYNQSTLSSTERLARALGWFSIALGTGELTAPSRMARLIGAPDTDATCNPLRAFGAREIASGLAILAQPDQARWLWSRAGGDALALAWLGRPMTDDGADTHRLGAAASAVAG